jgi:hypothetical protein
MKTTLRKENARPGAMTLSNVPVLHPTIPPPAGLLRVGPAGRHRRGAVPAAGRRGFGRRVFVAASRPARLRDALGARRAAAGAAAPASALPRLRGNRAGAERMPVVQGGRP